MKNLHSPGHDTDFAALQLKSFRFLGPTGKGFILLKLPNVHFRMFVFPQNVCTASNNVFYITCKNRNALMGRNNFPLIASATKSRISK